jgi:hypothetical protein
MISEPMGEPKAPELPQSDALKEASEESLSDLMSRDPEGYSSQDIKKIIAINRAARVKWEEMEKLEATTGKKKTEKTKADLTPLLKKASGSAEDMGL